MLLLKSSCTSVYPSLLLRVLPEPAPFFKPVICASSRVEIKKFNDVRSGWDKLKIKLQIKATETPSYDVFTKEVCAAMDEQQNYINKLEYDMAVAEAMDPVQVCFVLHRALL